MNSGKKLYIDAQMFRGFWTHELAEPIISYARMTPVDFYKCALHVHILWLTEGYTS